MAVSSDSNNYILHKEPPQFCEEENTCRGKSSVEFFCVNCDTFQCENCCTLLHIPDDCSFHARIDINERSRCRQFCKGQNVALVYCTVCEKSMCAGCDNKLHQGRRSDHRRIMFRKEASSSFKPEMGQPKSHYEVNQTASSSEKPVAKERKNRASPVATFPVSQDILEMTATELDPVSVRAVKLLNDKEELMVGSSGELVEALQCPLDGKHKVVSIFGNTGDGKSHTLNHTFFGGRDVFKTSSSTESCTVGIWAAYSKKNEAIIVDTEGLLGTTKDENKRTRLLMKVLAISDIVIYRTRAERLHNDMFIFLADASEAYHKYFATALKAVNERGNLDIPISALGPAAVIFHETHHTDILGEYNEESLKRVDWSAVTGQKEDIGDHDNVKSKILAPEDCLRMKFLELERTPQAYSSIRYVGTKTVHSPTDFSKLGLCVSELLRDNSVRASRPLSVIYSALEVLNEKFCGEIANFSQHTFPDQFFTCGTICLSCNVRCGLSMNHLQEGLKHSAESTRCKYQAQYDNKVYLCKKCDNDGLETLVVPKSFESKDGAWLGMAKYAWSGFILECPQHGVIYRSRQYWYGNRNPEETAVKTSIKHVWPGELNACGEGTHNAARRLIEGVSTLADAVGSVTAVPSKKVSSWMADMIAPAYWKSNADIMSCALCNIPFELSHTKHHCRACGDGFCTKCSSSVMPVPWRGWGTSPVKVCDHCYKKYSKSEFYEEKLKKVESTSSTDKQKEAVTARYVGEIVQTATQYVGGAMSYSKKAVVDAVRPSYWVSDVEVSNCSHCKVEFSDKVFKHHCRACGLIFCGTCSRRRLSVPSRGWDTPVRVCDSCAVRSDL